jgi:hypothetical protein
MKPTKEIGKRNGIVERFFESTGTIINEAKVHKHRTMRVYNITGKQYRRMMKQKRWVNE